MKAKLISGAMACVLVVTLSACGGGFSSPASGRTTDNSQSQTTSDGSKTNASTGNASEGESTTKSGETRTTTSHTTKATDKPQKTNSTTSATTAKPASLSVKPITYVPEMMTGTNVTFNVSTHVEMGGMSQWKAHVVIIRSYAELKKLYEEDQDPNKDINDSNRYTKAYSESFFKDNALVGLMIQTSSSAKDHKIDKLVKKDGRLCVGMSTRVQPADAYWPDAAGDFRTLITIKQADARDVTDIVVYNADWPFD